MNGPMHRGDTGEGAVTDTPIVTEADIAVALKHIGFDSVADLHYWATDNSELKRFDALCDRLARHRIAHTAELVDALRKARLTVKLMADTLHDRFNVVHNPYLESEIREAKQHLEAIDAALAKAGGQP